ncbi:hypothetical protein ACQEVZ_24625 [Dactylosporangium sp. CA-152071]|uniref:hypothetical protein n=1 Tax=Dactylosporangium sp. CA-152071 TaxID=3239933 RepID=UPI003D8F2D27
MGLFNKLTPEQQAAADAEKARAKAEKRAEQERQAFEASPQGLARAAYARGDLVLQTSFEIGSQQAIVAVMMAAFSVGKTADPSAILNAVASEGWDLVNGSVVFVQTGQESRDKFLASGQQVAVAGATIGYYLWRRR